MINAILLILSIILGFLPILVSYIQKRRKKEDFILRENIPVFIASFFLIIGCLTRVLCLDLLPGGLNQDEASSGYEAYSIMTYGIDRNGMSYPIHLISWGSGQNAAYSYFCIPFLKVISNPEIALRLPMALAGCLSLFLTYYVIKSFTDEKIGCLTLSFLAINPWHIMKSRWALESNLFPEMVLLGVLLLLLAIRKKNYFAFYLSSFVLALSSYSYGTSYFFLFFFVLIFLVYLLIKKIFPWYQILGYLMTLFVICIPIILFLYINMFDKETIHLLFFDIPKLNVDRFHAVTSIFSSQFLKDGIKNLKNGLLLLWKQDDGFPWNSTSYFGTLYIFTLPFSVLGLFRNLFRDRKEKLTCDLDPKTVTKDAYSFLLKDWLLVSLMMLFIISSNINRINIIWFPLIFLGVEGILLVLSFFKKKEIRIGLSSSLATLYLSSFVCFYSYYAGYWNQNRIKVNFYSSFKEALLYSESIEHNTTYISPRANYTLVLYYTKYDTRKYIDTVVKKNPGADFETISSFGSYVFSLPKNLTEGNTYIVFNWEPTYSDEAKEKYNVKTFEYYTVIDTTGKRDGDKR